MSDIADDDLVRIGEAARLSTEAYQAQQKAKRESAVARTPTAEMPWAFSRVRVPRLDVDVGSESWGFDGIVRGAVRPLDRSEAPPTSRE